MQNYIKVQNSELKMQNQAKSSKLELKYRTFYFSLKIIRFLETLEYRQAIKIISNQLTRSVTSVGANIVEAKGSSSKREFLKFFQIALKSSYETKYWLAMLKELLPGHKKNLDELLKEADQISRIISSSVLTMKGKRKL